MFRFCRAVRRCSMESCQIEALHLMTPNLYVGRAAVAGRKLPRMPLRPRHPAELPLAELERTLDQQGEHGGGYGSREQGHVVVQREPRGDALAIAARADERRDRGGAAVEHRRRFYAREDT